MDIPIEDIADPGFKAVLGYWNALRGDRLAPSWKEFELTALPPKLVPNITVVDVRRDPLDFVFRFWGTGHVTSKGIEKTGTSILEEPRYRGDEPFNEFRRVVDEKRPVAVRSELPIPNKDWRTVPITVLRLPLSNDGEDVHHIVSYSVWEDG